MDAERVRKYLKRRIAEHDPPTQFAWAVAKGVPPSMISEFLSGKVAEPNDRILEALKLEKLVRVAYVRKLTAEERRAEKEAGLRWLAGLPPIEAAS